MHPLITVICFLAVLVCFVGAFAYFVYIAGGYGPRAPEPIAPWGSSSVSTNAYISLVGANPGLVVLAAYKIATHR